jgi:glycosyltransferase involved in cell wall biosynthesis
VNVLFVLGGLRVGGYELATIRLANAFVKRRVETAVVTLTDHLTTREYLSDEVKLFIVKKWAGADPSLPFRLARVIRRVRPGVVVSCDFYEYSYAQLATVLSAVPATNVLAFHVTVPETARDLAYSRFFGRLDRLFKRKRYVAIHSGQADFYALTYGIPRELVTLIPNGVEVGAPVSGRRDSEVFTIINVANLKPLKDHGTLLHGVALFGERYTRPWRLLLVGADQTGRLAALSALADQLGIGNHVQFLGHVANVRAVLASADVFVLSSRTEALPVSALEAGAEGLPCVLTDVGGNADIVEDTVNGFLFPVGDAAQLAQRLLTLANDDVLRVAMGRRCREKVAREFSFDVMVERYLGLFERLAGTVA